jgi:HAD superfamily hydrolase (TIGR01484 family)
MRYFVLALDYDGTIAHHGRVSSETVAALHKLLDTGRRLVMVTGRELDELLEIFPELELFEWVVAENGALLYRPSNREEKLLAEAPPAEFVHALRHRGVAPISVGRAIVATWEPHQHVVLETIREFGLELQVIFNKGAVMVLPAGINKASGLKVALKQMNLSQHEVVGAGDAENDHAFLNLCECSAAVSNALPSLKERVNLVLRGDHGVGVAELIDELVANDLAERGAALAIHDPQIGVDEQRRPVTVPVFGAGVLIAGPSGSGKSTATTSLLEQLSERRYQFCIIDPEGDYESLPFAVTIGTGDRGPSVQEVDEMLVPAGQNVVVNLIGLKLSDRPDFFSRLLPKLLEHREAVGRPHWLIVDEAHHLLPPSWDLGNKFAAHLERTVFITVHPNQVHPGILETVGTVIAVGNKPGETLQQFCDAIKIPAPSCDIAEQSAGAVVVWDRRSGQPPRKTIVAAPKVERQRHIRKYAEGELPPDRSFYFRGPENKLKLRAQNLILFLQLADGIDDETWMHHLKSGDYSKWFRACIKDDVLAQEAAAIEADVSLSAEESKEKISEAVERRYTLPTTTPRLAKDEDVTSEAKAT